LSGVRRKGTAWALIPVKDFGAAKSRLRAVLSADECSGLALNMARDVVAAIKGSGAVDGISLLGSGHEVEKLAREQGCDCMEEFYDVDLSCNLGLAARQLRADGVGTLVVVPSDLPTLQAQDIEQLIAGSDSDLGLCTAGRDGGTNALVLSPPDAIEFQFGTHSARRHIASGVSAGLSTTAINHPAFRVDIDTPDDLNWLCKQAISGHTADFLDHSGIRKRILDADAAVTA
jgi:2-phospho-L-lactate guanylyltransferase